MKRLSYRDLGPVKPMKNSDKNKNLCQLCSEENQHLKTCNDCGLVFCPCSQIMNVAIVVDISEKCPNCGSTNLLKSND